MHHVIFLFLDLVLTSVFTYRRLYQFVPKISGEVQQLTTPVDKILVLEPCGTEA